MDVCITENYYIESIDIIAKLSNLSTKQLIDICFRNYVLTWNILCLWPFYWYDCSLFNNYWLVSHINFGSTFTSDLWALTLKIYNGLKQDSIWPFLNINDFKGNVDPRYWDILVNKLIVRADAIERKVLLLDSVLNTENHYLPINNQYLKGLKLLIHKLLDSYIALLCCENSDELKQLKMYRLYAKLYTIDMLIDKLTVYTILEKEIESEWFYFIKWRF